MRSRIVRCSSASCNINYIVNVCIMRMQEIASSYKYMSENCAGGLLDALVIVQYMHVLYITCGVHASQLISGKVEVMTGNQSVETISINRRAGGNGNWDAILAQWVMASALACSRTGYHPKPPPSTRLSFPTLQLRHCGRGRAPSGVRRKQTRKCGRDNAVADGAR